MAAVFGLLLMLLGASHAVKTLCDGRQNGAQCYGVLGGTLELQLMDVVPEKFKFVKNKTTILEFSNKAIVLNLIGDRSSLISNNRTLRINNLTRTDNDTYTLTIRNSQGQFIKTQTLHLLIQAPVSSVSLVSDCMFQGAMRVSCSSEGGDSPQYSWTLDGHTLTNDELLSGNNETDTIILKQEVSGQLVCLVRNHISNSSSHMTVSTCGIFINCTLSNGTHVSQWVLAANNTLCTEPTVVPVTAGGKTPGNTVSDKTPNNVTYFNQTMTYSSRDHPWFITHLPVLVGVVLSALVIVLGLGVAVICTLKKKKNNRFKEGHGQQELTYADVSYVQRRQVQQREEVEYGEIKFAERPRRTVETTGEECVYARVR